MKGLFNYTFMICSIGYKTGTFNELILRYGKVQ